MIALIIGDESFNRFHYPLMSFRYLSHTDFMRSFFRCCDFSMKATNSLEGFGIRIVSVVPILADKWVDIIRQRYDKKLQDANLKSAL